MDMGYKVRTKILETRIEA